MATVSGFPVKAKLGPMETSRRLYVQIEVSEHPIFVREGRHLYCEVPISFADAALGSDLEVPTLDGV